MIVWNAQALNSVKARIEARFAKRIARAASKLTGMKFKDSHVAGATTVWTADPESRRREYGDGVQRPQPWANEAIRQGVRNHRH